MKSLNWGYIKLHRKLLDNQIFDNEKALKIWIYCLLRANHKVNTILIGRTQVMILPGQFVFGSNKACEDLKMSKSTIHFWLKFLEVERYIGRKKRAKFSLISVLNWHTYQNDLDADLDAKRTLGVQINETNKNDKNEKNDKLRDDFLKNKEDLIKKKRW